MIYLNNAATSFPKPETVRTAVDLCLQSPPFHALRTGYDRQRHDVIWSCREALAALFHARQPERLIFTSGATESLCLALFGLDLKNAQVITTAIEHNSVLRPLKTLERQGAIELIIVEPDSSGNISPQKIIDLISDRTRVVVVNHCSNVTGAVTDLQDIGRVTAERGIPFLVDASQSAGSVPIDVEAMHIDLLAFAGHKSLYGIQGIGGLFIRDTVHLTPLKVGGTGVRSDYLFQPETLPLYYEAGTPNLPGIVSLEAGVSFILHTGIERIHARKAQCVRTMVDHLTKREEITLYSPGAHQSPGLFCFNIRGMDPADVGYILENSYDIITRAGLHCAPLIHRAFGSYPDGSVRVSPSYFTSDAEIDTFLAAIGAICEASQNI